MSSPQQERSDAPPSSSMVQTLRESLRLFWTMADAYAKRRLAVALTLVALGALLTALIPAVLKLVIDSLAGDEGATKIYLAPIALVILYVIGQYAWRCSTEIRMLLHGYAEQRVRHNIGRRMFDHLMRLPLRFHLERKTGALGQLAEQGMRGYDLVLQHTVYTVLPVIIELAVVAAVLAGLGHERYLAILGLAAVAYIVIFTRASTPIHDAAQFVATSSINAHAVLTDSLLNHETVKYFDAEPVVSSRYDQALGRTESAFRMFLRHRLKSSLLVFTVFALSLGACLVVAVRDVERGIASLGDFVLVNAYVIRLVQPLEMLGFAVRDIAQGVAYLAGLLALFREEPEGGKRTGPESVAQPTHGELTFEDVTFSYREQRIILKNVSLVVPARKTVAVVGVSGSGKSSLIRLLFRLYEPDSGQILLDGTPIAQLPLSVIRRAIAIVPQETVLFNDTIGHNIAFGRVDASRLEVEEAARLANLHNFIVGLPEGYETQVGERGLKLSGGERQRVAIARAALKRPRIAVFDEATSSLDSRTEREILGNLSALSSQCTTLVIAHRLSTVVHAHEIVVLHQGSIVERGSHQELLAQDGHYASLWYAQHTGSHGSKDQRTVLASSVPHVGV